MLIDIRKLAESHKATLNEQKGVYTFSILVAERRAFFSRKTLLYIARFRIDDGSKELRFTEMLKESGAGLSMGDVEELSPGFGFKKWAYRLGSDGRSGSIEEQSDLFGRRYSYKIDYHYVRREIEKIAGSAGYKFKYHVTAFGV